MADVERFRKRPLSVSAVRHERQRDTFGALRRAGWTRLGGFVAMRDGSIECATLNGVVVVRPGEWIVMGVAGEFYPCRDDVFRETYEPERQAVAPFGRGR